MAESTLAHDERRFYVYMIFRLNGVPCYVGKGCGGRWRDHIKSARNPHLRNIYRQAGGDLPVVKVRESLTEREAFDLERALVTAIGREAHGGPLVNLTDGGDGPKGYEHTEELKRAIGKWSKGLWDNPDTRSAVIAAQNEGRATADYRERRSAIAKRIWSDPARRKAMSETKKRQHKDPDLRAKISVATKVGMAKAESKIRQSAGQRNRFTRPEELAAQSRCKGRRLTPEHRRKIAAGAHAALNTPEIREKMRAAAKRRNARKEAERMTVDGQLNLLL